MLLNVPIACSIQSLHFLKLLLCCLFEGFSLHRHLFKENYNGWIMKLVLRHCPSMNRWSLARPMQLVRTKKCVRIQFTVSVIHSVIPWNCQMSVGVDSWGPSVIGWHSHAPPVEPYRLQKLVLALLLAAIWFCALAHYIFFLKKESFS